jgi:hypothetical protein
MTGAEFVAACFWPLVILFALLLRFVREPVLWRWIARWAAAVGVLYFILWFFYDSSSLVAIFDFYLLLAVLGGGLLWFGCGGRFTLSRNRDASSRNREWQVKAVSAAFGVGLLLVSVVTLLPDFFQPRTVLEGRVQNVRIQPGSDHGDSTEYLADIAGTTVKATTPVYERLKFLPVVRVEIGRGSRYIYKIEYLAN